MANSVLVGLRIGFETLNVIRSILSEAMQYTVRQRGNIQGLTYHRKLIDSIAAHDVRGTERIMDEHIDDTYETMKKFCLKSAEYSFFATVATQG